MKATLNPAWRIALVAALAALIGGCTDSSERAPQSENAQPGPVARYEILVKRPVSKLGLELAEFVAREDNKLCYEVKEANVETITLRLRVTDMNADPKTIHLAEGGSASGCTNSLDPGVLDDLQSNPKRARAYVKVAGESFRGFLRSLPL